MILGLLCIFPDLDNHQILSVVNIVKKYVDVYIKRKKLIVIHPKKNIKIFDNEFTSKPKTCKQSII